MTGDPKTDGPNESFHRWDDIVLDRINDRMTRRFVSGDGIMVAQIYFDKGAQVPRHSHHNEQVTWVMSGSLLFHFGDDGDREILVGPGEVLQIPGGVPHEAVALEDTYEVDVFTPPRQDWIDGTDQYLRKQ